MCSRDHLEGDGTRTRALAAASLADCSEGRFCSEWSTSVSQTTARSGPCPRGQWSHSGRLSPRQRGATGGRSPGERGS